MRSRAVRLSCGALALIALGAAAFFVIHSEKQLAGLRANGRAFDLRAREITDALSDLRAAQQAYVAAGQGVAFWMPKVAGTTEIIGTSIGTLRSMAAGAGARAAVDQAANTLADFAEADTRAREYLRAGQLLMAGDVIFTEGDQAAATAARQVETARLAEHQALDAAEAAVRRQEALALAGAGGLTAFIVLCLGIGGSSRAPEEVPLSIARAIPSASERAARVEAQPAVSRAVSPVLKTAAQLCTDFACMRDVNDLQLLLARAGDVMDAAGLVVWLGNSDGADLQPVLAQGYSDETRARLPNVPRAANNAAAAAYRSGDVQIVVSRPGGPKGAIVAPILGAQGCVGALSAEIRGGGEASESVQALVVIVAAQLAGVLAPNETLESETRAAASS
jgi:hypothetical protein